MKKGKKIHQEIQETNKENDFMKKLGKSAKECLISGISIALVGAGLYTFNITKL